MQPVSLGTFIGANRQEIVRRCRQRVAMMANWPSTADDIDRGIPLFLNQLVAELSAESSQTHGLRTSAVEHGQVLFLQGFTVSQVVHDYGNVCQSVTDLAVEQAVAISASDFRTLNRCLDDAIAGAVSEYTRQQRLASSGRSHELRVLIAAAIAGFEVLQAGSVGIAGTTGALVYRTLLDISSRLEPLPQPIDRP